MYVATYVTTLSICLTHVCVLYTLCMHDVASYVANMTLLRVSSIAI